MKSIAVPPIAITDFGRDHWALLAYVESICAESDGIPDIRRMRCNPKRHPEHAHENVLAWRDSRGTRLNGHKDFEPRVLPFHDDWDCITDLIAAGLVEQLSEPLTEVDQDGFGVQFKLTEKGTEMAAALRAHKARGEIFSTFDPNRKVKPGRGLKYGKGRLTG